jgi:aldehyde dehydrogenase (NAD+)
MSATQRGHLLWQLGDLIIANVDRLAAIEQRDNGKILSEACAQIRYMGDYFKYYGGLADKVQGAVIPTDKKGVFTIPSTNQRVSLPLSRPGIPR